MRRPSGAVGKGGRADRRVAAAPARGDRHDPASRAQEEQQDPGEVGGTHLRAGDPRHPRRIERLEAVPMRMTMRIPMLLVTCLSLAACTMTPVPRANAAGGAAEWRL